MQRTKNQHYVPRFYLKAFCADGRSLFVFDKAKQRPFKSRVENIASEQGFYDLPPGPRGGGDSQIIENTFSGLEGRYAAAVRDLIDEVQREDRFTPGADRTTTRAVRPKPAAVLRARVKQPSEGWLVSIPLTRRSLVRIRLLSIHLGPKATRTQQVLA